MRSSQGFGSLWHLAWRFLGAIVPVGPRRSSETWAAGWLLPGEIGLFEAMSGSDRRHAVGVARRALGLLAASAGQSQPEPPREFVAAALLHDVGKIRASLGTVGRVLATVAAVVFGRDAVTAWALKEPDPTARSRSSLKVRMGRYLMHDRLGAQLLEEAGSDPLTLTWAREHHLPEQRWTVEPHIGQALKLADGD